MELFAGVSGQMKVPRSRGLPVDAVMSGWLSPETNTVQAKDGAVRRLTRISCPDGTGTLQSPTPV